MPISFVDTQREVGHIFHMSGTFERMRNKIYVCAEIRIVPLTGQTHFPLPRIFSDIKKQLNLLASYIIYILYIYVCVCVCV